MKERNIVVCILLSLVTCGIYSIYWMIVLNDELNYASGRQGTSGGMVVLFTIITCGIYGFYWMYQMGDAVERIHDQRGEIRGSAPILYLILGIFGLSIVSYALMQNELNKCLVNG
ncbi:MAG: DUF4234 domain-containing protein [Lachnospiraceae bacterium]